MTQIFDDAGSIVGVTAIEAGPCPVLAVKDKKIQVGFDILKEKKVNRPLAGYFKKLNIPARKYIREILKDATKEYKVGEEIKVDIFVPGDFVHVTGTSIGKGFQGGMKRWKWHGGPQTHGSMSHRRIGSIGSTTTPGRVWKGHHLPGHMGAAKFTSKNLKVIKADVENNILLVRGSVPGNNGGYLVIRKSKKIIKVPAVGKKEAAKKK